MKDRHLLFRYLFGLTVCILFFPLAVSAADSFIHFKRLSVDDGLSQNTVLALTQDHNNKLWVGTIDGLNWYEGSRFVSYYKAPDDTTSLANNHVYSLHTDSKGTVWVGTQVGMWITATARPRIPFESSSRAVSLWAICSEFSALPTRSRVT